MLFEWDERKRQANLAKHHIDFRDAKRVFDGPVFERIGTRHGEDRIEIVVVYMMRGTRRRMISARRAHRNERQEYKSRLKEAGQGRD
jgi:uncharacterized DUF497 family protein